MPSALPAGCFSRIPSPTRLRTSSVLFNESRRVEEGRTVSYIDLVLFWQKFVHFSIQKYHIHAGRLYSSTVLHLSASAVPSWRRSRCRHFLFSDSQRFTNLEIMPDGEK